MPAHKPPRTTIMFPRTTEGSHIDPPTEPFNIGSLMEMWIVSFVGRSVPRRRYFGGVLTDGSPMSSQVSHLATFPAPSLRTFLGVW